jgi:hypothetical protein
VSSLVEHGLVKENRDRTKCCTKLKLYLDAIGTKSGAKKIDIVVISKDFVVSVLQTVDFAKSVAHLRQTVTLDVRVFRLQVSS